MKKLLGTMLFLYAIAFGASKASAQEIDTTATVTVNSAPPDLPVYEQPECPTDGFLWVPGFWGYDRASGYYWVPGVWVAPPNPGLLWTPAYWGFGGGVYGFHPGYWSAAIGFYGGINYGYGYGGVGFVGGSWSEGHFRYNTAVVNVNTEVIHNTYVDRTVIITTVNNRSFNGPGGIEARARPEEIRAMHERRFQPTPEQFSHQQIASRDRNQFANVNRGHPASVAMNRVGGSSVRERPRGAASNTRSVNDNANRNTTRNNNGPANANKNTASNTNSQTNKSTASNTNSQPNKNTASNTNSRTNKNTTSNTNSQPNKNTSSPTRSQPNVRKPTDNTASQQPKPTQQPKPAQQTQQPRPQQPRVQQPRPQQPRVQQPGPQQPQPHNNPKPPRKN